jgi:hypothetical protein
MQPPLEPPRRRIVRGLTKTRRLRPDRRHRLAADGAWRDRPVDRRAARLPSALTRGRSAITANPLPSYRSWRLDRASEVGGLNGHRSRLVGRRDFLAWASQRGLLLGVAGVTLPTVLAACGGEEPTRQGAAAPDTGAASRQGKPILGDVLDHALSSEEWSGAFGFVTFRLHRGAVDGKDVWFIRTDSSDKVYADQKRLVWAPKLATLLDGSLAGAAYLVSGGPTISRWSCPPSPAAPTTPPPGGCTGRPGSSSPAGSAQSPSYRQPGGPAGSRSPGPTSCSTRPWSSGRRAPCRSTLSAPTTSARDSCWRHPTPAR